MDKHSTIRVPRRGAKIVLVMAIVMAVLAPVAVVAAGGTFTDDDTSVFEADIEWMAGTGITFGCNPPDNDNYCPTKAVNRGQMAAFMHRLAVNKVVDAATAVTAESAAHADHANTADAAVTADSAGEAGNADMLDGLDSTAFLKDDIIRITQSSGWVPNAGAGSTAVAYANTDLLGAGKGQLALIAPSMIGADTYYLEAVEICYNMASSGDAITLTDVYRSNVENYGETVVSDTTNRTVFFPTSECYEVAVADDTAPADSAYRVIVDVSGSARIFRVTTSWLPGGGGTMADVKAGSAIDGITSP